MSGDDSRLQGDFEAAGVYAVVLVVVGEAVLLATLLGSAERRLHTSRARAATG